MVCNLQPPLYVLFQLPKESIARTVERLLQLNSSDEVRSLPLDALCRLYRAVYGSGSNISH